MSTKVLGIMSEKDKWLKKRRKTPHSQKYHLKLLECTKKLRKVVNEDHKKFIDRKVSVKDSKKMWCNLNEILGRNFTPNKFTIKDEDSCILNDPSKIADEFNKFFTNCAKKTLQEISTSSTETQTVKREPSNSIVLQLVSEDEVYSIIKLMKNKSASGHDGIGPKAVKSLAPKLVPMITHLINRILDSGQYPSTLKVASVTPIHKAGSKS